MNIKGLLWYNPLNGKFWWAKSPSRSVRSGTIAGRKTRLGYIEIQLSGKKYKAHRLASFIVKGVMPRGQIDHINKIRDDNRWVNLRECLPSENYRNKGMQRNNTSGHKGVSWHKRLNKWIANISEDGTLVHLGYYDSVDEAATAVQDRKQSFQKGESYV